MLFNRDILFLHVPKTGGMAVTKYLLGTLDRPLYYTQPDHDIELEATGVVQIPGIRHENLVDAKRILSEHGFELDQFKVILAVIRNPYDLEVSRFAYLQNGHPWDKGDNQDLAMAGDFEAFAENSVDHGGTDRPIHTYFQVDGITPKNLRILRTESLESDLRLALSEIGMPVDQALNWDNQSVHDDPIKYYTPRSEKAVYRRYQWVFEQGYYPRMEHSLLPHVVQKSISGPRIPIMGSVQQIGFSAGLWPDAWVDKKLTLHVHATEDVHRVILLGSFPKDYVDEIELDCVINKQTTKFAIRLEREHTPFQMDIKTFLRGETNAKIEITPSSHWCPRSISDSLDTRDLSFRLNSIQFLGESSHLLT